MEDHSGHHMPAACKMNMLFNWQVEDTCVVFSWWHISGPLSMLFSCVIVFLIAAFYESIRAYSTTLDTQWHAPELPERGSNTEEADQENVVYAYQQYKRYILTGLHS
ncbi:Ctr copper transporter family-domain-containing protein [Sporodiniella umbellata]|nr:Ctr copper transporter family-domain-containing protein [Sporodiniella umbellata]